MLEFTPEVETELDKSPDAFRTISEVGDDLDVPQHVLRFWETRFPQVKPLKRGGGRRYYRPDDVLLLKGIRRLLYGEGYTIKGVQRILKEQGARQVIAIGQGAELAPRATETGAMAPRPTLSATPAPVMASNMRGGNMLDPQTAAKLRLVLTELSVARTRLDDALSGGPVTV
jgi:DNA-binding transcriptional MerR regulator